MAKRSAQPVKVETISPRLLSYEDAARFLGIAVKTLRNWTAAGKYPEIRPRKLGGKPLFDRIVLERFCDSLPAAGDNCA
ncbi:MAG: helix-turn-helix domain-containing protein [Syntrophobacteraceae bacterium]